MQRVSSPYPAAHHAMVFVRNLAGPPGRLEPLLGPSRPPLGEDKQLRSSGSFFLCLTSGNSFFFSGWVCLPSWRRSVLIAQVFSAFIITQAGPCRSGTYYCRLHHIPYHLPLFVLIATIPVIKVTGLDLSFVLMTWNRTAARTTS